MRARNFYGYIPRSIEVDKIFISKKTYIGSNAYNKKAKVTSTIYNQNNIVYKLPIKSHGIDDRYKIAMPVSDARDLAKWCGVVLIGTPEYPFIGYNEEYFKPTLSDPQEALYRNNYIALKLTELQIVNWKNGKIYYRKTIEPATPTL